MLKRWRRYGHSHPEIVDLAKRRLCAQASSATSERALSKAALIISKKRPQLTSDDVDGISLLGWHYKDNGWGESGKRPRCVPQVEGERVEEESQMAAQQGFIATDGILKIIIVHMHYHTQSSMGSEWVGIIAQALLRSYAEHT